MELGKKGNWAVDEGDGNGDTNKYSCESRSLSELGLRKHCDSVNTRPLYRDFGSWYVRCVYQRLQGGQGQG